MRQLLDGKPIDELAIERIMAFEAQAVEKHPSGYWLAFSGGKDSIVILDLAKRAGVRYEAHYSITTVDPPELVWFVKTFPEVTRDKPAMSMWDWIRRKRMPPRRTARFCCEKLKESGGPGRIIITGIRWAESTRRSKRGLFEACYRDKSRKFLNPIIEWSDSDVWEYIRSRGLRYCSLYDEGWKRIGCVLCPMVEDIQRHLARWPKLCAQWERVVKSTWRGKDARFVFQTPEEYWQWWLDRTAPAIDTDPVLFDDDGGEPFSTEPPQPTGLVAGNPSGQSSSPAK